LLPVGIGNGPIGIELASLLPVGIGNGHIGIALASLLPVGIGKGPIGIVLAEQVETTNAAPKTALKILDDVEYMRVNSLHNKNLVCVQRLTQKG
jgi:hypothetical protein